jgi:hypothetical protein
MVAEDLLIFLEDKYRHAGETKLAGFLAKSQGCAQAFADWLTSLDHQPLEPSARAILLDDLQKTLSTMTNARGFTCT